MNKSPAFQMYPADYLSDVNTVVMPAEQDGHYMRLLFFCWLEGSIPSEPEEIRKLLKDGSSVDDETLEPIIKCFQVDGESGRLIHSRLDKERKNKMSGGRNVLRAARRRVSLGAAHPMLRVVQG